MEEMHRTRHREMEYRASMPSPSQTLFSDLHMCTNPVSCGILWKLHYIGIIDQIVSHW